MTPDGDSGRNGYGVIVVGAGHAGCEAALAAARLGARTLLLTMDPDSVAGMPCNPSIGGPAKGHLVREIDALGGEMARVTDRTQLQIRMLNTGKGPAVRALRAQCDKWLYARAMGRVLRGQPNLDLRQGSVTGLLWEGGGDDWRVVGVETELGRRFRGAKVIVTTGTFLNGRIIVGNTSYPAGRAGESPARGLSEDLAAHGFAIGRLKTGTPPRIDARTIDFAQTELQPGSTRPLEFSFDPVPADEIAGATPNPVYPGAERHDGRLKMACYSIYTNPGTHDLIRANLHRAPLFNGSIESTGPRYCPSIEDKIVRFADKDAHQLFLEPEGFTTNQVYVQGANTSLPEDVQLALLRSIPALANVEMIHAGYAIEYDFAPSQQLRGSLETQRATGLYLAGQINGTTGYEEAAGQGLLAGINAALAVRGEPPLSFRRDQAYLGVMIDDLITKEIDEPYRLHTSRAEYRLRLRQDNADLRLTPVAERIGLASESRLRRWREKAQAIEAAGEWLDAARIPANDASAAALRAIDSAPIAEPTPAANLLKRPRMKLNTLRELAGAPPVDREAAAQVEMEALYSGYIRQQDRIVERSRKLEHAPIPPEFDFATARGLRTEARQKLERVRPATLGQAGRINGVTPADIAVLMVYMKRAGATPG
ncbi:MAG: tRNA uridine-5-carboxymethylaminomethyl(34) synthesis enzyme MnmG [Chloroflexota bacterium]|jgi:tRNA uridine 5-carboxymethylaminomethyl modification enzyme|nr:tRNA uridine-5-carboxymethylaminomethyl(34) synthesis enzyme MnmG [Chloroflexota bacterium]